MTSAFSSAPTPDVPNGAAPDASPGERILERAEVDALIRQGGDLAPDALKAALRDLLAHLNGTVDSADGSTTPPPDPALRTLYLKRGLDTALDTRDPDLALLVTRVMDADPAADREIWAWLGEEMGKQPDAVYALVRARLAADPDERWLPRLQAAANTSLQVAIADGDWLTINSWLKLIGREPAVYGLSETFTRGVRLAQPRAHAEPDLAMALIVLTAKRSQTTLETLLDDPALMNALNDENLRYVMHPRTAGLAHPESERSDTGASGDMVSLLNVYGADLFLVAVARATRAHAAALITPAVIEQVWTLLSVVPGTGLHVSGDYTPEAILDRWIETGAGWLPGDSRAALLRLALAERRDHYFHRFVHHLKDSPDLVPLAQTALFHSGRGVNDVLAVISQMVANMDMSAQGAVNLFSALLRDWDWNKTTLLMMAQLARAVQYHPELTIETDVLWHMLDLAADAKEDLIGRVAARRLTAVLEGIDEEAAFAERLAHLTAKTAWNPQIRGQLLHWWRGYARAQNGGRLARLDKALLDKGLDGKKGLDELRDILGTVIALRRLIGKRTLEEFGAAVAEAYDLLGALAAVFDPTPKGPARFDAATVRAEIEGRADELSPPSRKILANNLKELAELIAELGDNRSKPGLVRRGDDLDRALMSGEQEPGGAVDTLKWMSGYLSGAQDDHAETEG
ncbi:MAG: hypothetical protein SF162_09925 [bacterium]|nr:hypothetical protein [bacterium]